jgi:RNA polymerase sigma-70 factor (ECF subfamily)
MAHPLLDLYFGVAFDDDPSPPSDLRRSDLRRSDAAPSVVDEASLVHRIRAGDVTALDTCVHLYGDRIVRVAQVTTHSRDAAWDVAQEVFLELWRTRDRLDPTRRLTGYLYRITRNRALDAMRHERSVLRVAHESVLNASAQIAENAGAVTVDAEDFRRCVHEVLRALPPRCREIFLLYREAGMSYAEIEAALGVSNATIRNQVSRATRHLAEALAAGAFDDWVGPA